MRTIEMTQKNKIKLMQIKTESESVANFVFFIALLFEPVILNEAKNIQFSLHGSIVSQHS